MLKGFHIADGLIMTSTGAAGRNVQFLVDEAADLNCFYHLNYNVACLLKMMGITQEQAGKLIKGFYTMGGYKMRYLPGKFFSIEACGKYAQFCDTYQYHADELWRQSPDDNHRDLAKRAKEIGDEVLGALQSIGLTPLTLTSPIRAYQIEVLNNLDLPTVDDIPEQAGQYAYACVKGNLLEAYKIGHFDKVYDYDIVSAYPSEMAKLLDIRKGKWKHTKEHQPNATYGFCKVSVDIQSPLSPIIYAKRTQGGNQNYAPKGTWPDCLTKAQIDAVRYRNIGGVEIEDGWWWSVDYPLRPYERIIDELYEHKEKNTGLRRTVIKRVPNGLWGKSLEIHGEQMGDLFNPVYGSVVETNTEIKVIGFCLDNGIDPIHIAVDGVLALKDKTNGLSGELGGWKKTNEGACFVMGAGTVALDGKRGKGDFSLDYHWVADQIEQHPDAHEYTLTKPAAVSLPMALRGNWDKLGTMQEISRTIDVSSEDKRLFLKLPETGKDLYDKVYESEPLDVVQVMY